MDISTSIAQMSMGMSSAKLAQGIETSMMKKAMESQEAAAATLLESMPPVFPGENGFNFSARA